MRFSEALLQQIKESDLVAYIQSIVPDIILEPHGSYYTACCPHPDHDDEHPSFRVWHNKDGTWSFACMSCHSGKKDLTADPGHRNYGTDAIAFTQWMSDYKGSPHILSFEEAVLKVAEFFKIPVPAEYKPKMSAQEIYFRKLQGLYHYYFMLYDSEPKEYCKMRGLNQQDAATWQIGTDGAKLIFPLFDEHKSLKGFISRTVRDESPKYIHSSAREGFIKSEFLYGLDKIDRSLHSVYVTEGVFDVITATKYGVKNVVACLGTSFMESHAQLLKKNGVKEVTFVFDGDTAGQNALKNAIKNARAVGLLVSIIILPNNLDLDEFCRGRQYRSKQNLEVLKQFDYEYELETFAQEYQSRRNMLQNRYLRHILSKATMIQDADEYAMFCTYILNHFDMRLEQRNVREIKTNLAHSVSAKTQATAKTTTKATA